jgi:thiaminase
MPEYTAEIDISPDEFISDCSSSEIKEIIEALIEEWDNICEKIRKSRLVMTQSDEDTIRQIFKGL